MTDIDARLMTRLNAWLKTHSPDSVVSGTAETSLSDPVSITGLEGASPERMLRAQEVWEAALDLWQDEEDAFEFLTRRHVLLDDERPILVAVASRDGVRSVRSIIERLRYGSAA